MYLCTPLFGFQSACGGLQSGHWPAAALESVVPSGGRRAGDHGPKVVDRACRIASAGLVSLPDGLPAIDQYPMSLMPGKNEKVESTKNSRSGLKSRYILQTMVPWYSGIALTIAPAGRLSGGSIAGAVIGTESKPRRVGRPFLEPETLAANLLNAAKPLLWAASAPERLPGVRLLRQARGSKSARVAGAALQPALVPEAGMSWGRRARPSTIHRLYSACAEVYFPVGAACGK